ncbi:MAG: 3-alpha,7-alpha,12-alpha-trihydroxy-5-beta-cholest-24-enoyl-CoA hydratase [Alphaproteobacteria bacterium]|nr:MAG: 3-alpha,7-alpha,12-alpha-trihydroxy-5-beta-cholest-24-enoyl-CoA hydratase [Alphaproteobacteria bacterium]
MALDYQKALAMKSEGVESQYTDKDVMLYALGVGMGRDPMDLEELRYTYEKDLKTVPTMATVIQRGGVALRDLGLNFVMLVHGEQRLTVHKPLPAAAEIVSAGRIVDVIDKGKDKGALVLMESTISEKATGDKLCTLGSTLFFRGDGGFGGPSEGGPEPHPIPDRAPDMTCELKTEPGQALLYRLNGDRNPLHSDPDFAKAAGFPRPILHGLCTYGTACRAVLKTACDYDHTKIKRFDVRFSSPVFPGETIVTDMWRDGDVVSFECKVKERDVTVIRNGRCDLG